MFMGDHNISRISTTNNERKAKRNDDFLYRRTSPVLSWRLDPDESLSDWTISVVSSTELGENASNYFDRYDISRMEHNDDNERQKDPSPLRREKLDKTKLYFVHRAQLAVGPRRSEFFANVFKRVMSSNQQNGRNDIDSGRGSSNCNSTKVELIPEAASCFPIMLDYMYSAEGTPLAINTDSAVALRQLASSFGVRSMFRDTTQFIKQDLNSETAMIYLLDACKFKNRKLETAAKDLIARKFLSLKFTKLVCIPPNFMKKVIQSKKLMIDDDIKFSQRIASYCRCRDEELTLSLLDSLTPGTKMTVVDEAESLYFLHLIFSLKAKDHSMRDIETMNLYKLCLLKIPKALNALHNSKPLSNDALNKNALRKQRNDLELYNSLPSEIKIRLLESSFEYSQLGSPSPEVYSRAIPSLNERRAKEEMFKLKDEVQMLRDSYDKKVYYYKRMLDAKVEELRKFTEQSSEGTDHNKNIIEFEAYS
jgi:hypothetical protein